MPNPTTILAKLDKALRTYAPVDKLVYKRVYTKTGGDALIGRGQTTTSTDTLLDPQPMYRRMTRYPVGPSARAELIITGGETSLGNSFSMMFSATAMPLSDLENPNLIIVFKDTAGNEELFRVTDFEPTGFQGTDVLFIAYIQSLSGGA